MERTVLTVEDVFCLLLTCIVIISIAWGVFRVMNRKGIKFHQVRKFPREDEKVKARLEYYTRSDGWHVTFNIGFGACYGIVTNLNEGDATKGEQISASLICGPDGTCGYYRLYAL